MFEKEAIRHAFEDTIGVECLIKPVEDFTYEELSDEQQEKAYDFKKGAEFGYKKGFEECAKARLNVTTISDCPIKDDDKLQQAMKQIHNLLYVYQLGKNELATARIRAEAEQFLKDNNYFN